VRPGGDTTGWLPGLLGSLAGAECCNQGAKVTASDFVLSTSQRIVTYGTFDGQTGSNPILWVTLWPSVEAVRITGGTVDLLASSTKSTDLQDRLVLVSGTWDERGAIRVSDIQAISDVPGLPAVWGDEESTSRAASLDVDASTSVYRAARENACGLSLASGGSRSHVMTVKVLHVCQSLAAWHEREGAKFVTLLPSIVPETAEPTDPPFAMSNDLLKAFGISTRSLNV
jgi:hypothetical protein